MFPLGTIENNYSKTTSKRNNVVLSKRSTLFLLELIRIKTKTLFSSPPSGNNSRKAQHKFGVLLYEHGTATLSTKSYTYICSSNPNIDVSKKTTKFQMLFRMQTVNQQTRLAAQELDGIYINPVCVYNLCETETGGKVFVHAP